MGEGLNVYSLPRLFIFIFSLSVGSFVFFKNRKSAVNRSFFIVTLCVSLWQFSYFVLAHTSDVSSALLWSKLGYLGVIFITPATYHFVVSFLNLRKEKLVRVFYFCASTFISVVASDYLIVGVKKFFWGYYPLVGPIHNIFLVLWAIPFILALRDLYKNYKVTESPFNKKRIKYFLFSLPVAYLGSIDYLPNYGIELYPLGFIPITFFIVSTSYAVVRYRLLDIEFIIKKVSLISLAVGVTISTVFLATFYVQPYLYSLWGKKWLWLPVFVSFLVSFGLFRVIGWIRQLQESELSKKFAYRSILKKEAKRISMVKSVDELLTYTTRDLANLVRLDYVGIFIWHNHEKKFVLERSLTRSRKKEKIPLGLTLTQDNPLIIALLRKKTPLVSSEIEYYLRSGKVSREEKEFFVKVLAEMKRVGAEISLPSFCEDKLLAIINIGHKLNLNEIITNEDLEVFASLSNHIARAIDGFMLKEEKIKLIVASQKILISAIEAKDRYTSGHTERVADYCALIGNRLTKFLRAFSNGLSNLNWAAQLHDVGKISIPDVILLKPGPLNEEEWRKIKEHPINGVRIIAPVQEWLGDDIYAGILHHHENFDGSGYPRHQKGEGIHLFARIIRVADAFDAMTSDRPYRRALTKEEAINELTKYKGIYFDPRVAEVMMELYRENKI